MKCLQSAEMAANFRKAAELLTRKTIKPTIGREISTDRLGCCDLISVATHSIFGAGCVERNLFEALFKPPALDTFPIFWWDDPPADREARILALLLAAEWCETEGCFPKKDGR